MIELKEVTKIYGKKNNETKALDNISLLIANRGMVSITGESGCGKTTLLNVISGLDKVTSGKIFGIKKEQISFIFQDFQLIENLSVKDNLLLFCNDINKINDSLNKVEMTNNIDKKVNELSGGQKQRIAIARALCLDTQFILCDEPTGNLDSKNSKNIASLLKEISKDKLVLIVTHDVELFSSYSDRIIRLEDGKVISDQIINEVEDIEIDENQKSNKNIKFTFKNMLKIKKSLDFKNVTTKIFNILFSVVILLAGFISIDLFTNSHGDIVKKAAESYGHSTIDFRYYPVMVGEKRHIAKYTLQDLSKFGFNTDDCALGINVIYNSDQLGWTLYNSDQSTYDGDSSSINPQGFHYNRDEQRFDFGFSKFYVTDDVYSPLLAGKKHLEKNEIIISRPLSCLILSTLEIVP